MCSCSLDPDPRNRYTLWSQVFGHFVVYVSTFISSQMMIQRYYTVAKVTHAQAWVFFLLSYDNVQVIIFSHHAQECVSNVPKYSLCKVTTLLKQLVTFKRWVKINILNNCPFKHRYSYHWIYFKFYKYLILLAMQSLYDWKFLKYVMENMLLSL